MSSVFEVEQELSKDHNGECLKHLEEGQVVLFPKLDFPLLDEEKELVTPSILSGNRKNVSFNPRTKELKGALCSAIKESHLRSMLARYSQFAVRLASQVFGSKIAHVRLEKVSFRPSEIKTRVDESVTKDDKRLHVDAFPSNPTGGARILRLFTNINFEDKPRIWKIGESFSQVASRFVPSIDAPIPFSSFLLHQLRITKARRTLYDHYMLKLHDRMKESMEYQEGVNAELVSFQPHSTWMVFTDQVSHAVLSGQHVLEQTFSVAHQGLSYQEASPCKILEQMLDKHLL